MNSNNVQFGENRLKEILINQFYKNSNEIISDIQNKIKNFSSDFEELDDTTFMLIKIKELSKVNK